MNRSIGFSKLSILAAVFIVLCFASSASREILAGVTDDTSILHKITVANPNVINEDGQISLIDAENDFSDGVNSLDFGLADMMIGQILLPFGACNNARDCAIAITESCAVVDPTGPASDITVEYIGSKRICDGVCSNGRTIVVTCSVLPSPIR